MNSCDFDVLHALTIKGMARCDALADTAGLGQAEVLRELDHLCTGGLAVALPRRDAWRVIPPGRERHAELLESDTPAPARERLYPAYERFLPLNLRFKDACARWQVRGGVPNDHGDPEYDRSILADLGEVHAGAESVIADLGRVRDRFTRYGARLRAALLRVRGGDRAAFTGVLCGSYHDVWMELHRDLLLSLRLDRSAEEARQAPARAGL